jgi:hypothetical protein
MIEWDVLQHWFETHESLLGWMGVFSLLMFFGTLIAVPMIIVALPKDFLWREDEKTGRNLLNLWYFPYLMFKNIMGAVFILAGLAMLVLPGQGLLTMLLGLGLITFPGKRRLIHRILGGKRIVKAINKLRSKFGKPPITLPDQRASTPSGAPDCTGQKNICQQPAACGSKDRTR